jgi:hypothetical protein
MAIQTLYPNQKPSLLLDFANVKALDPRITFTRTTTATYYDGKTTAKAEENLFIYSQQFDDGNWQKQDVTVTANNQTAPDGTTTAETITDNATNGVHIVAQTQTLNGLTATYSVFAKKGTADFVYLRMSNGSAGINAFFNLDTGAIATVDSGITASIQNIGNGWYRCVGTWATTSATAGLITIGIANADNTRTYVGTGSTIFVWGAQVEQRSAVTDYTPTTTQPITNYIPVLQTAAAGQARFDHNPTTGESLGLLVEEQRTNSILQSEDFTTTWTTSDASITANTIVAPDGTLTGDKLVENTANNVHILQQTLTFVSGTSYAFSVYLKAGERTRAFLAAATLATFPPRAFFDLSSGTVISTPAGTASIVSVGNGWYRCSVSGAAGASAATNFRIVLVDTGTNITYTGDGYSGIYIWGAQFETGAFPTSYIPTVAATVTRNADAASMTGTNFTSWYRADEGTFYAEAAAIGSSGGTQPILHANGGADTPRIMLIRRGDGKIGFNVFSTVGDADIDSGVSSPVFSFIKSAAVYKVNDFALTASGVTPVLDTSGNVPIVDRIGIGFRTGANAFLNGHIRKVAFYPSRLANAQLQALTTV